MLNTHGEETRGREASVFSVLVAEPDLNRAIARNIGTYPRYRETALWPNDFALGSVDFRVD